MSNKSKQIIKAVYKPNSAVGSTRVIKVQRGGRNMR